MAGPSPLLPIEVRAAIGLVALHAGSESGLIHGRVVGRADLCDEVRRYARVEEDARHLIALDVGQDALREGVRASIPDRVVTLSAGPLAQALQPLRRGPAALSRDLPIATWRLLGYERIGTIGLQGFGSLIWAAGERMLRRVGRPDLADRCRIGMLRTLTTLSRAGCVGTTCVRCYRRTGS